MMRPFDRREFLSQSALAALAAAVPLSGTLAAAAKAKRGDATAKLRVAVVGVRGRGMSHVGGFLGLKDDCEITTICDCDEAVIGKAMKAVEQKQGKAPRFVQDIRKVVEDKDIDIVSIAMPNHWHALAAIWAMQNGKDVYVEKPVSHNVSEGRRIVEVARKTGRMCQAGTQIRSMSGIRAAMDFLHAGKLGPIKVARGLCYKPRGSIGHVSGPQPVPKTCDYDLWCGPAEKLPLMRKNLHYDWHWVWNTGNGDLGNQGIHQMDVARWGLGKAGLPKSALSFGGRFGYVDDGETANTQVARLDYGDCEIVFEVRGLKTDDLLADQRRKPTADKKQVARVGNVFIGSEGYLVCPSYGEAVACRPDGEAIQAFTSKGGDGNHFANFLKAVRSRKFADLNGEIEEGHLSSALCHLANISYRLGSEKPFGAGAKDATSDKATREALDRMEAHLKANGVDLDKTQLRVGRNLTVETKTETFVGDRQADAALTRAYRKGFEVPEKA